MANLPGCSSCSLPSSQTSHKQKPHRCARAAVNSPRINLRFAFRDKFIRGNTNISAGNGRLRLFLLNMGKGKTHEGSERPTPEVWNYNKSEKLRQPSSPHAFISITPSLSACVRVRAGVCAPVRVRVCVCVFCPDESLSTRLHVSLPALCGCHGEFRAPVIKSHLLSA